MGLGVNGVSMQKNRTQSKTGGKRMKRHPSSGCRQSFCPYILTGRQQGVWGLRRCNDFLGAHGISYKVSEGVASVQSFKSRIIYDPNRFLECVEKTRALP